MKMIPEYKPVKEDLCGSISQDFLVLSMEKYAPLLDKANIPVEKREQFLKDMNCLVNAGIDAYFRHLDSDTPLYEAKSH
jgi:hypothetical protein